MMLSGQITFIGVSGRQYDTTNMYLYLYYEATMHFKVIDPLLMFGYGSCLPEEGATSIVFCGTCYK
jgi:hypothetical protein